MGSMAFLPPLLPESLGHHWTTELFIGIGPSEDWLYKGIAFEGSDDFPLKLQMSLWSCYKSNSCNPFLVKQTQFLLTKH